MDGPLMSAIKKRKGMALKEGDHQDMTHSQDSDKDLHGFVAGLQDHEKDKLQTILTQHKEQGSTGKGEEDSMAVAKGQPSSEEKAKIGNAIDDENMKNNLEAKSDGDEHDYGQGGTVDSDAIGKSMLDSRYSRGTGPSKPRNLSDRVKMTIADNLKAKRETLMNVDQDKLVAAAEGHTETPAPATEAPQTQEEKAIELDGLSEFSFKGEKLSPDQFHKIYSEYKTLSEESKTWKENEKFEKNLSIDIDNVLQDPRLAQRFKQVYPQKYHYIVDKLLSGSSQASGSAPVTAQDSSKLPKEVLDKLAQLEQGLQFHNQRTFDAEVKAANAELDAILPVIWTKYPLADEDSVYARAEKAIAGNQKLTKDSWERFARESHDAHKKKNDQFQSAIMKEQKEKAKRGDAPPGGMTPGQKPVKPRTFDEAREAMLASIRG